jgi:hypothetical protein
VVTLAVMAAVSLKRFQAKWTPVRVKKTRQNKRVQPICFVPVREDQYHTFCAAGPEAGGILVLSLASAFAASIVGSIK